MAEHPLYPRFNDSIVPESNASLVWLPSRVSAPNADSSIKRQSKPYFEVDLSNCVMNSAQKEQLIALQFRQQGIRPVLMRVAMFCEGGISAGFDPHGKELFNPVPLGVGNGTYQTFQLRKPIYLDGYENEPTTYFTVRKPEWNYPTQKGVHMTANGPVLWKPMADIQVYLDGEPLTPGLYNVDKDTGLVSVQATGVLTWTGGFYILMLMPARIPLQAIGGGLWQISEGIKLTQPFGGAY